MRVSDATVLDAFRLVMDQLSAPNSQVRYLSLLLVGYLFQRSAVFRVQLTKNFPQDPPTTGLRTPLIVCCRAQFASLTVGLDKVLPMPRNFAGLLRWADPAVLHGRDVCMPAASVRWSSWRHGTRTLGCTSHRPDFAVQCLQPESAPCSCVSGCGT